MGKKLRVKIRIYRGGVSYSIFIPLSKPVDCYLMSDNKHLNPYGSLDFPCREAAEEFVKELIASLQEIVPEHHLKIEIERE